MSIFSLPIIRIRPERSFSGRLQSKMVNQRLPTIFEGIPLVLDQNPPTIFEERSLVLQEEGESILKIFFNCFPYFKIFRS